MIPFVGKVLKVLKVLMVLKVLTVPNEMITLAFIDTFEKPENP